MSKTASELNEQQVDSYLFQEMADGERAAFEGELFDDDELFVAVAERENDLIDLYVRGKLSAEAQIRFDRTLADMPARRQKVANAGAFRTFIDDERVEHAPVPVTERLGLLSRLTAVFASPVYAASMAALVLVMLLTTILLLRDNREKSRELGRLQEARTQKETDLASIREQFDREHESVSDLAEQTDEQQSRIAQLEQKLKERELAVATDAATPERQTASVDLARPDRIDDTAHFTTTSETRRVIIRIPLPITAAVDARYSVEVNGRTVARALGARIDKGEKSVRVTVNAADLHDGANQLRVLDASGAEVTRYAFYRKKE